MIRAITRLQLGRIKKRVAESHKVPFTFDDEVINLIASRCTELESGGRMIDTILTNTLLPSISGVGRAHFFVPDIFTLICMNDLGEIHLPFYSENYWNLVQPIFLFSRFSRSHAPRGNAVYDALASRSRTQRVCTLLPRGAWELAKITNCRRTFPVDNLAGAIKKSSGS